MRRQSLDTLQLRNPGFSKRYNVLIPEGRLTEYDNTEIPVVRNKTSSVLPLGESSGNLRPLLVQKSARLSSSAIDQQLRSIAVNRKSEAQIQSEDRTYEEGNTSVRLTLDEEKKEKTNLKFLRYKFNPTEEPVQALGKKTENSYGQYKSEGIPITINMLYERSNVFFEDTRVASVYKRFFVASL